MRPLRAGTLSYVLTLSTMEMINKYLSKEWINYKVNSTMSGQGIDIIIKNKTTYMCAIPFGTSATKKEAVFAHGLAFAGTWLVMREGQRVLVMEKW